MGPGKSLKGRERNPGKEKTFLRPNFFLVRLEFSPAPLTAPGSPRMGRGLRVGDVEKTSCKRTCTPLPPPQKLYSHDHCEKEFLHIQYSKPKKDVIRRKNIMHTAQKS